MEHWIYIIVCVGLNCPFAIQYSHMLSWETKPVCQDAADQIVIDLQLRDGFREHRFYSGCANRG